MSTQTETAVTTQMFRVCFQRLSQISAASAPTCRCGGLASHRGNLLW